MCSPCFFSPRAILHFTLIGSPLTGKGVNEFFCNQEHKSS